MRNWSRVRTALLLAALYGVLHSASAFAGIEEHNPNPMPEWLQQELAVYTTDGADEARALDEDEDEVEHDEPSDTWHSGSLHLQQHSLDEHALIKWRLALYGLQYVTIEELLMEERIEEEDGGAWSPSDSVQDEGSLADEATESDDTNSDTLESSSSALTRADPGDLSDSSDEPLPAHGCSARSGASHMGFGFLLFLVWIAAARLRWS